jgi:hypothetical protein
MRFLLLAVLASASHPAAPPVQADIVVYGGTAAGVTAAIQAQRLGRSVLLVAPELHIGGMSVEGLGSSDIDNHYFRNHMAFGGLAREFYSRIGAKYGSAQPVFKFESSVAESVFDEMLRAGNVQVLKGRRLREPLSSSVEWDQHRKQIRSIRTEDGSVIAARYFIDATIEGDLLAAARVTTVIGREANATYGETKNGIRDVNEYRQFPFKVDPYKIPGDPSSGVLPTIQDEPLGVPGSGDHRLQGYCFRLCLTRHQSNQIPIQQPPAYSRAQYELYVRYARQGGNLFQPSANLPNAKTDLGSWHDLSANLYGMNYGYPGGSYAERRRIYDDHREFTHGLLWFLANDPDLPERTRAAWKGWGLCKDEFTDNAGWPRSLYVRDARRMVSDYVITEHHTRRVNPTPVEDPVAVAYWPPDTHHVRRIVRDGAAYNEGFVFGGEDWGPFGISYRSLLPRTGEVENLITPTVLSSSHVAYGAIRIEWTFMALGQAAGTASALAARDNVPFRDVSYPRLRTELLKSGQVMSLNLVESKTSPPSP